MVLPLQLVHMLLIALVNDLPDSQVMGHLLGFEGGWAEMLLQLGEGLVVKHSQGGGLVVITEHGD